MTKIHQVGVHHTKWFSYGDPTTLKNSRERGQKAPFLARTDRILLIVCLVLFVAAVGATVIGRAYGAL